MVDSPPPSGWRYKVKLIGGRIVGPIDLDRVRALILKKHILGSEQARIYPDGDWANINQIPEIADLLILMIGGKLKVQIDGVTPPSPTAETIALDSGEIKQPHPMPTVEIGASEIELGKPKEIPITSPEENVEKGDDLLAEEKTVISSGEPELALEEDGEEKTIIAPEIERVEQKEEPEVKVDFEVNLAPEPFSHSVSQEKTVIFSRKEGRPALAQNSDPKESGKKLIRMGIVGLLLALLVHELFFTDDSKDKEQEIQVTTIRPRIPSYIKDGGRPEESEKLYAKGIKHYLADTVLDYRKAAEYLLSSASYDATNVKSLAMLASTYLNLIDSSNKDDQYFAVISKLIELSRAKSIDLPETIIADVEYYIMANKADAAHLRIIEYTKSHSSFGMEMFYYIAYVLYAKGDYSGAARYIGNIPDNQVSTAKIFFLKGQIAEALGVDGEAFQEYQKALKINERHAKSRVRIVALLHKSGKTKEAATQIEFLRKNTQLLTPKDIAAALYYSSMLKQILGEMDSALVDLEKAVLLDRKNHDYMLELYALRARTGDKDPSIKKKARMYYFIGEGEKAVKAGHHQEALNQFLAARQEAPDSPLPLVKIGDMFLDLKDYSNALPNFKKAASLRKDNIDVWSKYVEALIHNYEWEEALAAIKKFRSMPNAQSASEKLAGDLYIKQGMLPEGLAHYKKAMSRDTIDADVYVAFARALASAGNCTDAPFFYALGLRFDPLNFDAIIGTANCVAETESIDKAISDLQFELQRIGGTRAELLTAIAELQIRKGDWRLAQASIDQASQANPEYAVSWKLQAELFLKKAEPKKEDVNKALDAYKSYSDRNPSDPSGYLERYRLFIGKGEFDKALEELNRIYVVYPKYPGIHFYRGTLYSAMGNHSVAVSEFKEELKNNPNSVSTLVELGKVLVDTGSPKEALDLFTKAMQLAPLESEPKHQAGYANYLLKNYQGAAALFRAAIRIDQGNPLLYKRMGLVFRDMGDGGGAKQAFQKYLELAPDAADRAEFERYR